MMFKNPREALQKTSAKNMCKVNAPPKIIFFGVFVPFGTMVGFHSGEGSSDGGGRRGAFGSAGLKVKNDSS